MFRLLFLLALVLPATAAYSEGSYLMIPDAVEQAEEMSHVADRIGQTGFQPPRSANEALGKLRRIDHNLTRIVQLGGRFKRTAEQLEKGLYNLTQVAEHDRHFVVEWGPVIKGNYQLMKVIMMETNSDAIRHVTAMAILETMVMELKQRQNRVGNYRHIELKFTREGRTIEMARERLHQQLIRVRYELTGIRQTAEKKR